MKKQKQGKITSDRMQSTVVVETISLVFHPIYGKTLKRKSRFVAHNPDGKAKLGDTVKIVQTKPLSKTKRWKVVEIIKTTKSELEANLKKRISRLKKSKKKGVK